MSGLSPSNKHEGVSCDGCMTPNFSGNRYKCLRCFDFDLCHACYTARRFQGPRPPNDRENPPHTSDHPVQCILSQRDFELLYEGDPTKNYMACKIAIFTCPHCGRNGLNHNTFYEHIQRAHSEPATPPQPVNCPMCIACPDFDANREVENMLTHWASFHVNFEPGTPYLTPEIRTQSRRPMLARRTARQPAGNAQNQRRTNLFSATARTTMSRLYAEVLAESALGGNAGAAAQAAAAQYGIPWTSELAEVDDMFRMFPIGGNRQVLTASEAARFAGVHLQPLTSTGTAGLGLRTTARGADAYFDMLRNFRGAGTGANEYAAPTSSRTTSRTPHVPSVQVIRPLGTTPIYPTVMDEHGDDDGTLSQVEYDLLDEEEEDDEGSSTYSDGEEYASAEEGAENAEGEPRDTVVSAVVCSVGEIKAQGLAIDQPPTELAPKPPKKFVGGFIFEDDESDIDDDDFKEGYVATEAMDTAELSAKAKMEHVLDQAEMPNPIAELRRQTSDAEWAHICRIANEDSDCEEDDERADTPRAILAGCSREENRDPQCWLTVQLDTSQLPFANPTLYWTDKRFLRQRKKNRELSVASDAEKCIEQADLVEALLRSGVDFPIEGRELDNTSKSVRNAMKNVKYVQVEAETKNAKDRDVIAAASCRLQSETNRRETQQESVNGQQEQGPALPPPPPVERSSDPESSDDSETDDNTVEMDDSLA